MNNGFEVIFFPESAGGYQQHFTDSCLFTPAGMPGIIRAKKKVVNIPPASKFHHNQFPEIPLMAIRSVTHKGVSAANVVATIQTPAMYHGIFLPPKK